MSNQQVLDCRPGLAGRVAVVTGGLGGIGRECVVALLAHGANVAFTYVEGQETSDDFATLLAEKPEHLSAHILDLQSNISIRQCLSDAKSKWGRVDILINNAAVGSATVSAFSDDAAGQDTAMLNINADGVLKTCQAYLELMQDDIGDFPLKIINLSSVGGGIGVFPGFRLSDGMSKAAVAHLTRQLAAELTDRMIDVFAICPGATNTKMFQSSTLDPMSPGQRDDFVRALPKHRLIEPSEIANIIVFLASTYSTPLHGAVLDASMGLGVHPGLITGK
jgi:NAD(P)-dependent dehydrogenase (short-subunit alcohol dehydrogenase family)